MEDSDITLMQRLKVGNIQSFDQLLVRHHKRVLNIIYKYIGDAVLAEDLVQEVFLRVYKARVTYQPTAKFTTWLYQIVKNLCLQKLKKGGYKVYSMDSHPHHSGIKPTEYLPSPGALPLEIIEQAEVAEVVKAALAVLPPNQRMALVLNKYEGLAYNEIAESMSLSFKAVKSLLSRARVSLKEKLAAYVALDK